MIKLTERKVFRDPLYGYIKVDEPLIWELIQTKEFQRLRRIHQLGGTHMVYHTAEHTRFAHSLGTYEVARLIITEVSEINEYLTEYEKLLTLVSALLHDLGHGPFSHAFEQITSMNHEELTNIIISGDTEVNSALTKVNNKLPQDVVSVINKTYPNKVITDIISSQLDADRLDYLQRDAYFTGATYGEIDLQRILRSFLVIEGKIAFKKSSMHAIENYLVSRFHMYWQVYFHPVGRSYEILLVKILERYKELEQTGYIFKFDYRILRDILINQKDIIENYFELDEPTLLFYIKMFIHENDGIISDLSDRFINRKLLKYKNCLSKEKMEKETEYIEKYIKFKGFDEKYYVEIDSQKKALYDYYMGMDTYSPIYLYDGMKIESISELSPIVKGMAKEREEIDYKIYYPKTDM